MDAFEDSAVLAAACKAAMSRVLIRYSQRPWIVCQEENEERGVSTWMGASSGLSPKPKP